MASRRGCHAAFVLQSRLKTVDRPSIRFEQTLLASNQFPNDRRPRNALSSRWNYESSDFSSRLLRKKKEEERKWENRRKKRVEKRGGWQEWEVDEAGRRIISGDDVGTESNWRKEGPDAEQREEGRGMQNGKSIGCTERTRPRTTKIIFSLTRSRRGNHRDGMEIARGIEYSTLFFRIERAEGSLDIPSDVDPLNFLE